MLAKKDDSGILKLKNDLKTGKIGKLYIFFGSESYMKEYYLEQLTKAVVEDTFREFNLQIFEGNRLTLEQLSDAIESYPAMAERKMVILKDLDLYKPQAALKENLPEILSDLPNHICLVIVYDVLEFKEDKRLKMDATLKKYGCIVEFSPLDRSDLIPWIKRRARALDKTIENDACDYLLFMCGSSMTNLITEIDKAAAHSVTDAITKVNIDAVCSKVLEAVIFDLTDSIAEGKFEQALQQFNELILQKNDIIMLFAAINRHILRLYGAKLAENGQKGDKFLFDLLGTKSSFYVKKIISSAAKFNLAWLRQAVLLCGETDVSLKSANIDRQKTVELMLLTFATDFGGTYDKNSRSNHR